MTPVTKQAWIDALRSGEYSQAKGSLARVDENGCTSYCCLGVLATITGVKPVPDVELGDGMLEFDFDGSVESGIIPLSFRDVIVADLDLAKMITTHPGLAADDDLMRTLTSMNDRGASFLEIADYLERL